MGILEIARRRAKLWLRPSTDFYRTQFLNAMHHGGNTWAYKSWSLLRDWHIPDLVDGTEYSKYSEYIRHVKDLLFTSCATQLHSRCRSKCRPLPYVKLYVHDPT